MALRSRAAKARYSWVNNGVTSIHTPYVILLELLVFHRLVYRNNADLGKGVPRQHVFHEAWELLFFRCSPRTPVLRSKPSAHPHVHPCITASRPDTPALICAFATSSRGHRSAFLPVREHHTRHGRRMRPQAGML